MNENTTISLELLLLNDLFNTKVIDRTIYEKAAKKLRASIKPDAQANNTVLPATA